MKILNLLNKASAKYKLSSERKESIHQALAPRYEHLKDPWGFDLGKTLNALDFAYPLYRHYFQVRLFGESSIAPHQQYLFVGNHSGQIAIDGFLLATAMVVDMTPPRIVRGMIERWMAKLPFVAEFVAHTGSILGDRQNCLYLLKAGESIMTFPEGVRGVAKSTREFYHLRPFTTGFLKMAIKYQTPILPFAFIGVEEVYPLVYHPRKVARQLGLPALPLSPFFLLGPLGLLPLPSPVDIYFAEPIQPNPRLTERSPEGDFQQEAQRIRSIIVKLIETGLKNRRPFLEDWGLPLRREL